MCNIYDDNRHVTTSYLIGAFPSGFVIGKLFFKKILDNLVVVVLALLIALEY